MFEERMTRNRKRVCLESFREGKDLKSLTGAPFFLYIYLQILRLSVRKKSHNPISGTLIQSGGGTGPMKPGNLFERDCLSNVVPIPAEGISGR
jgi:hypothetical protein